MLFSLFLPSMNKSLFEKCNVLLSLMTNNSSMNRIFHIQFHLCPNFLDDKIRTTVQLITYTVLQNCLSMFTIHCNSQFPYVQLMSVVELSAFFFEGHHLSKIRLGANVTDINCKVLSSIYPVLNSSSPISSSHSCCK